MKQRSGSSSLSALKLKSFILQFSEMISGALYTSHERSRVFTGSLRVVCECTHIFRKITGSVNAANLTIREQMPEHITRVFSGISVWKGLMSFELVHWINSSEWTESVWGLNCFTESTYLSEPNQYEFVWAWLCCSTWAVRVSVRGMELFSSGGQEVRVTNGAHVSAVPLVTLAHQTHDQILQLR